MLVGQFLRWIETAPAAERADATSALARAYLHSELNEGDRTAAVGAMLLILDDRSPLVRRALSHALAPHAASPAIVVLALAADQADVAAPVLRLSPHLADADLVELAAAGSCPVQSAIAQRRELSAPVAAAIVEVGSAHACLHLAQNSGAIIAAFSFERLIERFGKSAALREALFARADLPIEIRHGLLAELATTLSRLVVARDWIEPHRAERLSREACEKATIALTSESPPEDTADLVVHLRQTGQLTAGLILRAILSGNSELFEAALAELAGVPRKRVNSILADVNALGFRALHSRAGLPASTYPAFRAALDLSRDGLGSGGARLDWHAVERALQACEATGDDLSTVRATLRRFAAEAARDQARLHYRERAAA